MKQNPNWIQCRISSFLGFCYTWIRGELPPNIQGSGNNSLCMPNILPNSFVVQRSIPVQGITQLGLQSHPTGLITHEVLTMTLSFLMSEKPVYTTMSIRPFNPCHPTQAVAGPFFLTSGIPIRPLQAISSQFLQTPLPRASVLTWGILRSQVFGPVQNSHSASIFWSLRR